MITDDQILRMSSNISVQQLGEGEGAVVLELDTGQLHTCNDTTALFLAALDGNRCFGEVLKELMKTFEVGREELRGDLEVLAENLLSRGIVE